MPNKKQNPLEGFNDHDVAMYHQDPTFAAFVREQDPKFAGFLDEEKQQADINKTRQRLGLPAQSNPVRNQPPIIQSGHVAEPAIPA